MRIIIEDFIYNGKYFEKYECELPQIKVVDETFKERIAEYVVESWLDCSEVDQQEETQA